MEQTDFKGNFEVIGEDNDTEEVEEKYFMIPESLKILKVFKFVISLNYFAGCCYFPYILCFSFDSVRPYEWTTITLWLIEIFIGLLVIHKDIDPPYQYSNLVKNNLKKGGLIIDLLITVTALVCSVLDQTIAV